uniref:Uncharacterized protein n=1 Tax=Glossina austeni TaxID=7395 RepID=A0A1A9VG25_GLOAU
MPQTIKYPQILNCSEYIFNMFVVTQQHPQSRNCVRHQHSYLQHRIWACCCLLLLIYICLPMLRCTSILTFAAAADTQSKDCCYCCRSLYSSWCKDNYGKDTEFQDHLKNLTF